MSKEYNYAGKNLVVDGITILGTRTSAKGAALTNAINTGTAKKETAEAIGAVDGEVVLLTDRVSTAEGDIDSLEGRADSVEGRMDTAEGDIDGLEGRMDTAEGDIDGLDTRMGNAEGDIASLETVTKRFDVSSNQTSIIRDDTDKGFQIVVLHSTIIGYENPSPVLQIMTNETYYRICAMEANPSQATVEALTIGASVNPTPSNTGSWYRGGQLFSVGDHAMYILYTGSVYITVELVITAKTDSSVTGTIVAKYEETAKGVDDRTMTDVTLYIPFRRSAPVEAFLYNGNTLMAQLIIPVTDRTRKWKEIPVVDNKEELDELTEDEDGLFIDGDCCVVRYEYNEDTQQYDDYQLNTYVYKNDEWILTADEDAAQQIQTIYTYMGEAAQYKIAHPEFNYQDTVTGSRGVFAKMMAGIIYAGQIFANEIRSTGYAKTPGAEFPASGFRLSTQEDLIEAVKAVFMSARIKESSLEDVTISITDGATSKKLLESTLGITPPANPITMAASHETGYYVESSRVNYKWNGNLLTHYNGRTKCDPSGVGKDAVITFTVRNDCKMYFRAPFANFAKISGSYGTMTTTVIVNGTTEYTNTVQEANVADGTSLYLHTGDSVEFSISYNHGNAYGISGFYYNSKIYILEYKDRKTNSWVTGGTQSDAKAVNAYCVNETASTVINNTAGTTTIRFPVMDYADTYVATELDNVNILVNDTTAANEASLVQTAYDAITALLTATGTRGGTSVSAIPRNVWVDLAACTLRYKKRTFAANQLYLAETYAVFAYNGAQICTISADETSTLYYSVTLNAVDPSLTVGDLKPSVSDSTDIGSITEYFDNGFINHVQASSITKQPRTGARLDIVADSFSGPLTGNVTGDVTGNVNSSGTTKKVYGAVFNDWRYTLSIC